MGRGLRSSPPRDTEVQRRESAPLGGDNCLWGGPVSSAYRPRTTGPWLVPLPSWSAVHLLASPWRPPGFLHLAVCSPAPSPTLWCNECRDARPSAVRARCPRRPRGPGSEDTGQLSAERARRSAAGSRCPSRLPQAGRGASGPGTAGGKAWLRLLPCLRGRPPRPSRLRPHLFTPPVFSSLSFQGPVGGQRHTPHLAKALSRVPGGLTSEGPRPLACWASAPLCRERPAGHGVCPPPTPRKGPEGQSKGRRDRAAQTSVKEPVPWPWQPPAPCAHSDPGRDTRFWDSSRPGSREVSAGLGGRRRRGGPEPRPRHPASTQGHAARAASICSRELQRPSQVPSSPPFPIFVFRAQRVSGTRAAPVGGCP